MTTSPESPDAGTKSDFYQRSYSIGYARKFGDNFGAGINLRYASQIFGDLNYNNFMLGLGIYYRPEIAANRLNIGFSLMNLGSAIKFETSSTSGRNIEEYYPNPAQLNLGISYLAMDNNYFRIPLSVNISKPFDKLDDNNEGVSSFKNLFSDWKDFPEDVAIETGVSFEWLDLNLGNNFYFTQDLYLGNFTSGPKAGLTNFSTHGIDIGIKYNETKLTAGYAGVWYNARRANYLPWNFPYETVSFTLSTNPESLFSNKNKIKQTPSLKKIILSAGAGSIFRIGRASKIEAGSIFSNITEENKNSLIYSIEGDFYINNVSALVSKLSYTSTPYTVTFNSYKMIDTKIETFSLSSAYRFHPVESFNPFFIQGGVGIYRLNPITPSTPRYFYETALELTTGTVIPISGNLSLLPEVAYNILLTGSNSPNYKLAGFNQINLSLSIGYNF